MRQANAARFGEGRLARAVGGRMRLEVILLLGGVLGLDGADKATVGAIAGQLKTALDIGNIQIGLLVTVSTGVGALTTMAFGALVDRVSRVPLLSAAIVVWSLLMLISGLSGSYTTLLLSRLALGAALAVAAPAVASLTGDFFPAYERGRIWGYLLGGELAGSALGLLISGTIAGWLSWRAAFWVMSALGFVLAALFVWRLSEPERGATARLPPTDSLDQADDGPSIEQAVDEEPSVAPDHAARAQRDPNRLSFVQAMRYILTIRTNVLLIVASALGYFFFTGLRSFGVVYISGRFGLDQSVATLATVGLGMGSIAGVLISGQLADRLIARRHINARVLVPGAAFILCAGLLIPGILAATLWVAGPLLFLSAASFGATNPPIDAARMDIIHSHVWGRAESVRTCLRYIFEAGAPLAFGYLSTLLGPATGAFSAEKTAHEGAQGLVWTFLIMSIPLLAAGAILLFSARSYPRDVANALAAERASGTAAANP